jgi:hypothetical protein
MSNTFITPRSVATLSQSRIDYNNTVTTLLQNFASEGQPSAGSVNLEGVTGLKTGMLWYKSGSNTADGQGRFMVYDGSSFVRTGLAVYRMPNGATANIAIGNNKISSGELIDIGDNRLYMVNSSNTGFVDVGTPPAGFSLTDAATLDGLDSTQFLRSDVADTIEGPLTGNPMLRLTNSTSNSKSIASLWLSGTNGALLIDSGGNKRISWNDGVSFGMRGGVYFDAAERYTTTGDGAAQLFMNHESVHGTMTIRIADIGTAEATPVWQQTLTLSNTGLTLNGNTIWNAGNDGTNSGLDADTLDGVQLVTIQAAYASNDGVTLASARANDLATFNTVSANLFNTFTTLTANDGATLASARANDLATFTTLTANIFNTFSTLSANDGTTLLTARANDFSTFITLSANDGATLLTARANDGVTLASALANDGVTILSAFANDIVTLNTARANDGATLLTARANDFTTFTTLSANDGVTINLAYANDGVTLASAQANDGATLLSAYANDYTTWFNITSNSGMSLDAAYANDGVTLASALANDGVTINLARANDLATLNSARANDGVTLLTARANDFSTFSTLSANDGVTLLNAYANDGIGVLTAYANDGATLTSALANDGVTLAAARANDGVTLNLAYANDGATLLTARSNDFSTWSGLNSAINLKANIASPTFTGSVAVPERIVHDGDTDTALRFQTDTISLETAGIERMRLNSTGNIGIGTVIPTSTLHVVVEDALNGGVTDAMRIQKQTNATPAAGIGVSLEFAAETSASNIEVGAIIEALTTSVTAGSENFVLVFKTMNGGAAATEALRLGSAGQIGVNGASFGAQGSVLTSGGIAAPATWSNAEYTIAPTNNHTLTNTTALQKIFGTTLTNGALTLPVGSYEYDIALHISGMSANIGNAQIDFKGAGTATISAGRSMAIGFDTSTPTTPGNAEISTWTSTASATNIFTAGTGTGLIAFIKGAFRVTSAGTIIPSIALVNGASAIIAPNSYARFRRIYESATTTNFGPWS